MHAFIRRVAQGDNSTSLLFVGVTIGEEKISADFDRLLKEKQTAMRVDHYRLGILAEVLAIGVLARSAHGYIDPHSQAAAPSLYLCFRHRVYRAGRGKLESMMAGRSVSKITAISSNQRLCFVRKVRHDLDFRAGIRRKSMRAGVLQRPEHHRTIIGQWDALA